MNLFFLFCCFDQQWLTSSERKPSPASAIRESGFRTHNINYVGSMEMFWNVLQWSDCRITSLWTFLVAAFLPEPTWPADSPSIMSPSVCGHWPSPTVQLEAGEHAAPARGVQEAALLRGAWSCCSCVCPTSHGWLHHQDIRHQRHGQQASVRGDLSTGRSLKEVCLAVGAELWRITTNVRESNWEGS